MSFFVTVGLAVVTAAQSQVCPPLPPNPLEPLTFEELKVVSQLVKQDSRFSEDLIFSQVNLKEPPKKEVLTFRSHGAPFGRIAQVLLYSNTKNRTFQVLVDLKNCAIVSFKRLHNTLPGQYFANPVPLSDEEINAIVLSDKEFRQALAERNIPQSAIGTTFFPSTIFLEAAVGKERLGSCFCPENIPFDPSKGRLVQVTYFDPRRDPDKNIGIFAWIDGLIILLDVTHKKVVKVINSIKDFHGLQPLPPLPDPLAPIQHPPLKPLCTTMPEGPSFTIQNVDNNHEVTWENWKFRLSWHPYTGVKFYQITYNDNGTERDILYQASLNAALVSYDVATPLPMRHFTSYDSWAYPLLGTATSEGVVRLLPLVLGRDVPSYATLLAIPNLDINGNPLVIKDLIGIYEQDGDLLYRAISASKGSVGARGRQLVVRSIFAGIIYLWIFSWIFNQDGSIEAKVDVGGQTFYEVVRPGKRHFPWGELTARQILSHNHTHIYNYRFDFDIDGTRNIVTEENKFSVENGCFQANPCGQAVRTEETVLKTEKEAQRNLNLKTNRAWIFSNPHSKNRLGQPHGFELEPVSNATQLALDCSWIKTHLGWVKHHLTVTRFRTNEQFAAGNFPLQQLTDVGIGRYIKNNESIVDEDIVAWYTLMFQHTPNTQDFPYVVNHHASVKLVPHNFFEINPAVSIPEPQFCTCTGCTFECPVASTCADCTDCTCECFPQCVCKANI